MNNWWNKYYKVVRSISELGISNDEFADYCKTIENICDDYGVNFMSLYISKPEYDAAFQDYGIDIAILTDHRTNDLCTLILDDNGEATSLDPITINDVQSALSIDDIESATSINASYNVDVIESVAHNLFNDLMNTHREDLSNHTDEAAGLIEDAVRTQYAEYDFDPQDIGDIIDAVFDNVDSYNSTWADYFGKFAYDKYGDRIANIFQNQIISKRLDDLDKDYRDEVMGLRAAAKHIGTVPSMILQALEGMCYNNKAYEFDDSHYFVGSYEDWQQRGDL